MTADFPRSRDSGVCVSSLQALLARVEGGTGEDRELDADIVRGFCPEAMIGIYVVGDDEPTVFHAEAIGIRNKSDLPRLLTSLDAAVALVERRFPGVLWGVGLDDAGRPKAGLNFGRINGRFDETYSGQAPSQDAAARALIAALLRAEIARMETTDAE